MEGILSKLKKANKKKDGDVYVIIEDLTKKYKPRIHYNGVHNWSGSCSVYLSVDLYKYKVRFNYMINKDNDVDAEDLLHRYNFISFNQSVL